MGIFSTPGIQKRTWDNNSKKVLCLDTGVIYNSQKEVAEELEISQPEISIAIKRCSKIKGLTFVRYDETNT